jgi:hypothetical protein
MPRRDDAAFLKEARERFKQGQDAIHKQRQRELADLAFYEGGENQWDPETLRTRKAQNPQDGLPPVPARPCLTINRVREPVHQVLNQERQSDMGIELVPADDFGQFVGTLSEDEIELREGLVRRIQRDSEAADARTWAFTRAVIAGAGYYVVRTRYAPGKTWDQEVYVARIYNNSSVTLDPAHEQPDGSDAEWAFIGSDMPWAQYKREFKRAANGGRNEVADADDDTFRGLGEEYPGWFKDSGDQRSARVVEYYYTDSEERTLIELLDGSAAWKDEIEDEKLYARDDDGEIREREVIQKKIKWAKIDAKQILDETDWDGPDMPVIKVLGEEMHPHDAERKSEGMVRPARDPQQGFNAMFSKWVEMIGLTPMSALMLAEGQWDGYEQWYQMANTRTLPFLPFRRYNDEKQDLGQPQTVDRNTPIQALTAAVQMFDEAIKSTTMVPSVQLGHATDPHIKSGKAIDALTQQGQLGTSHFLDNLKRSVRYEGQVINNLLYPIYGRRPGRLARIVTGENEAQTVRIGAVAPQGLGGNPMVGVGANGGAAPQSNVPGVGFGPQTPHQPITQRGAPKSPKTYTLTPDANFNVMVKVVRNFDSRRQEESSTIGQLIGSNPAMMGIFGDLFFKNQDGPGHAEMAERAKAMLDPKVQAIIQAKEQGQGGDPAAQAQIAQMKAQLDQAHQVMAQAKKELTDKQEAHQREMDTKLKIAQIETDRAIRLQEMKNATAIRVAELGAKKDFISETYEDAEERLALGQEQLHEHVQGALEHQRDLEKTQLGHQQALEAGAQGHAQALEQGAQQAVQSEPTSSS